MLQHYNYYYYHYNVYICIQIGRHDDDNIYNIRLRTSGPAADARCDSGRDASKCHFCVTRTNAGEGKNARLSLDRQTRSLSADIERGRVPGTTRGCAIYIYFRNATWLSPFKRII
jgi:hypothetical protein